MLQFVRAIEVALALILCICLSGVFVMHFHFSCLLFFLFFFCSSLRLILLLPRMWLPHGVIWRLWGWWDYIIEGFNKYPNSEGNSQTTYFNMWCMRLDMQGNNSGLDTLSCQKPRWRLWGWWVFASTALWYKLCFDFRLTYYSDFCVILWHVWSIILYLTMLL